MNHRLKGCCALLATAGICAVGAVGSASAAPLRDREVVVDMSRSKLGTLKISASGGALKISTKQYVLFVRTGLPNNYTKMVGTYTLRGALTFTAGSRTARVTALRLSVTRTGSCLSGLLKASRIQLMCGARTPGIQGVWEADGSQVFPHLFAYRADNARMGARPLARMHSLFGASAPVSLRGALVIGGHVAGALLSPTPGTHEPFSFASPYIASTDPPAASPIEVGGIAASTGTGVVTLSSPSFGLYSNVHKTYHWFDRTRIVMNAGAIELRATVGGVEHIVATGSVTVPVATNIGFVVTPPTNMVLTADGATFVNGQLTPAAGKEWAAGERFLTLRLEAPALVVV